MFERFTERSRRVIVLSQEEARLLKHNYIGTEHLLLGLLADGDGGAARTLEALNVTLEAARQEVREIIGEGPAPQQGHIPFTPRAKKVLETALREALKLGSQSIESVHLLLGLVSERDGVGAQIIERLGASVTAVRERAAEFAGHETEPAPGAAEAVTATATSTAAWPRTSRVVRVEGLGMVLDKLIVLDRRLSRIERHLGIPDDDDKSRSAGRTGGTETAASEEPAAAPQEPPAASTPATPEAPDAAEETSAPQEPAAPEESASNE